MNSTKIEWTESTWNPTTGCSKVSIGCKNCYAERWAKMQNKRGIEQYRNAFELTLAPSRLKDPIKWKRPKVIFVNSMSDLFHEKVPDSFIVEVFKTMNFAERHTFQLLTKRVERIESLKSKVKWSDNIWLGVSVESNDFLHRIDQLKQTACKIKFISFEPLLTNIEYSDYFGINWVVVGGESGSNARRIEREWVVSIKNSCEQSKTPFFFKQWGKRQFNPDKDDPTLDKHHPYFAKGGCMIEKTIFQQYPN